MAMARMKYQPVAVTWTSRSSICTRPMRCNSRSCSISAAKTSGTFTRCASSMDSNSTRPWHISAMMTARRSRSSRVSARPRTTGKRPWDSASWYSSSVLAFWL